LIRDSQHGFCEGFSCVTNLLFFLEEVTANIDVKHKIDTIYFDLAKTFDTVPHQRLLAKLKAHGISGLVLSWIEAWLSDRWQCVCLDGVYSSWRHVWSGVPQGSVLGPILFLIFINDLDEQLSGRVLKFTDDTKLFDIVDNQTQAQNLQKDIDILGSWAQEWQMKFNVEKCKVVHYGRDNIGYNYTLYGQPLTALDSEKDLGVVFSNDLKVGIQNHTAYSKASQSLSLIHRIIKFKNPKILIPVYKSMVRPHLEYCTVVWSPHYVKSAGGLTKHRVGRVNRVDPVFSASLTAYVGPPVPRQPPR